ncbi:CBASS cGAMP synthase [Devosia neptuniae]|uniref:Cyclic GMP-AMP synthase n=1 Tax=Devosia neptuniae TaxID=191302 RepID=A0ABY6C8K3_9HYPH|nr:CBASS cGAMP synthase [Devosia neptuniae]UXN68574.1 CBASS cGAMP synthase [Devosia neptuniae]
MALNAHRLFENQTTYGSFHSAITVTENQENQLRAARDDIRSALKRGLRDWADVVEKAILFEDVASSFPTPPLRPRFHMQGSFSYRTQVEPAQFPPQQIDLDDGLFLPVSYLTNNGARHPVVASKGLFAAVERILLPLCKTKGWKLGDPKDSCVRVEISQTAHVDVALYAIPDAQFAQLVEDAAAAQLQKGLVDNAARIRDEVEFDADLYRRISGSEIMLAHRKEGWKPSDPRKLGDWYQTAVDNHGSQVRRVSKYLKGWRDFQWESSRLSSIAIMAGIVAAYDADPQGFEDSRDDLAILSIAKTLPAFLSARIDNPVVDGQRLDEGWSADQRNEYVAAASSLANLVRRAIEMSASPTEAVRLLQEAFGQRIPKHEDLIEVEALPAPAVVRSAEYREQVAAAAVSDVRQAGTATRPWSSRNK